ncbi:helix-turn-helix domain-containing protein [Vagococcus fluvialis]|uniref:helix-turn-helix domain-containing protein n=1 Tax=Vagococcus fluvialis TaxID=2738 RepID=UPI001D09A336|nr:helix-turn-helix domain-containing protein [Vagococcus fluvialis]UDM73284.1 helix-turn-helix domain-containing protein [Vagococcus fluvialis]
MKEQPNYYAIIPAQVRYSKNLIPNSKLLYGEITALSNEKGYCWASDNYFQKLYGVGKSTIQNWLRSLEKEGFISREVKYKTGSKEIEQRYIRIMAHPIPEKWHTLYQESGPGYTRKMDEPIPEKWRDNNTSNTTINNTYNNIDQMSSKTDDKESIKNSFESIWKLYPKKQGKDNSFKAYKKAIKDGISDQQIIQGIEDYKKQIEIQRTEMQYVKNGSTFFNQRCYLDEFITMTNKRQYQASKAEEVPPEWAEEYAGAGQFTVSDDDLLDLPF